MARRGGLLAQMQRQARLAEQQRPHKEFFFATPAEVRDVLLEKVGSLLEFAADAEATEY